MHILHLFVALSACHYFTFEIPRDKRDFKQNVLCAFALFVCNVLYCETMFIQTRFFIAFWETGAIPADIELSYFFINQSVPLEIINGHLMLF